MRRNPYKRLLHRLKTRNHLKSIVANGNLFGRSVESTFYSIIFRFYYILCWEKKEKKRKRTSTNFSANRFPPSSLCQTQQTKSKRGSSILLTEKKFCRSRELVPQLNAFEKIDVLIRLYRGKMLQ